MIMGSGISYHSMKQYRILRENLNKFPAKAIHVAIFLVNVFFFAICVVFFALAHTNQKIFWHKTDNQF